jgi:hypothetical protein
MNRETITTNLRDLITSEIAPYCVLSESNLGPTTSYFIHLSLDKKEDWINGIFHNSRYAIFAIQGGKLELISKGLDMPKFRKCNAKDEKNIAEKILKYCLFI